MHRYFQHLSALGATLEQRDGELHLVTETTLVLFYQQEDHVRIGCIATRPLHRRLGMGRAVMQLLCDTADETCTVLDGVVGRFPQPEDSPFDIVRMTVGPETIPVEQLRSWYETFGFRLSGKTEGGLPEMIRLPKIKVKR